MVKLEDEAGKEEGREEGVVGHLQEKVGHLQILRETLRIMRINENYQVWIIR